MSRERIRTIKPEFFRDEKIKLLSRDARLVAVGLISRSDDRGRQANESQGILGHIFPGGDVTAKQLARWLGEILMVCFARPYADGPFEYLWLPNFWKHQVINKPTESDYPQHPEERFAHLSIKDAIKAFRKEQDPDQVPEELREFVPESVREDVQPPRAGAHSVPFLSSSTEGGAGGNHRVDPNQPPDHLADNDHARLAPLKTILDRVHAVKGGTIPTVRSVGLVLASFPSRDHLRHAADFEAWWTAGVGANRPLRDVVHGYRNWVGKEQDSAPGTVAGVVEMTSREYVDAINAKHPVEQ